MHVPLGWRPTILQVRLRRCCASLRHDTLAAAGRNKLSREAVYWPLKSVVINRMLIARVAGNLGTAWHTVNGAVLEACYELLISDPARFNGVRVIGLNEHVWSDTGRGSKYVSVIIDLTPIRDGTGPSMRRDMVPGPSKKLFKAWLDARSQQF